MTTLLLQLDSNEADPELTAALFREAHTVKGGAAMVSLEAVAGLAHTMEDVLSQLRDGLRTVTPELVDALLAVVEALSSIIPAAVSGIEHEGEVAAAQRALAEAVGGTPEVPQAEAGSSPARGEGTEVAEVPDEPPPEISKARSEERRVGKEWTDRWGR